MSALKPAPIFICISTTLRAWVQTSAVKPYTLVYLWMQRGGTYKSMFPCFEVTCMKGTGELKWLKLSLYTVWVMLWPNQNSFCVWMCVFWSGLTVYLSGARCVGFNLQTWVWEGSSPGNLLPLFACSCTCVCACISAHVPQKTITAQSIPAWQEWKFAPGLLVIKW